MKKNSYAIIAALLILVSSCHHDTTVTGSGNAGSWSFAGTTYTAGTTRVSAGAAGNSFYGFTGNSNTTTEGTLSVQFYGGTTPGVLVPGTYTIAHQVPPDTLQVYIVIKTGGTNSLTYGSQVGYGPEMVTVSEVNGKYKLTASGIKLMNLGNIADSNSTLTINATQQ